jgi:diketogulonate reductase-like aldo/keto reductase
LKYREFSKTGFKVSVIGMGTYYDSLWIFAGMVFRIHAHHSRIVEALKKGLDAGINFIDTAEIYQSEPLVSEAIKGRKRDDLFIASKVWSNHLKSESVIKSCKRSLSKLNTSYLDLYQIHFPNSRVRIEETMVALEKLVDEGLTRAIGVSNFSYSQMIEAEQALKRHELSSTQMHYNVLHKDVEKEILPHCEKQKIAMIPYYPLAHGKLARERGVIESIASNHKVSNSAVALGWLVNRSEMNFPIPRASRATHILEDVPAGELDLSSDEMNALNAISS